MACNNVQLSIIIPVYNTEPFLRRCLQSVVRAVEGIEDKVEALIINDGSPDNSEIIINEFCCLYGSWMKQYKKQNGGLSDVKNFGLKRARGEFVVFLDSDDYIEPEMYKSMLEAANNNGADVVICDIRLVYDEVEKNCVHPCTVQARPDIFSQIIDLNMMPASWNKIVRRNLYEGLSFPIGINNEDVAVTPIVLARAQKIAVINEAFYNYYQRSGSIQNSSFNEKRFVILQTSKMCIERLAEIPKEKGELIKNSIYVHQVLSLAFYPIRYEPLFIRYKLLKKYMIQVNQLFPDIWENAEVKEFQTWEGSYMQLYRKISCSLLRKKLYLITSCFWEICALIKPQ